MVRTLAGHFGVAVRGCKQASYGEQETRSTAVKWISQYGASEAVPQTDQSSPAWGELTSEFYSSVDRA